MQEVLALNAQPSVDQNAITEMALIRFRRDSAIQEFKKEFGDVLANPLVHRLAVQLDSERTAALKELPDWSNHYRAIGNELRALVRPSQPATPATGNPSVVDKEAKKASIVNLKSLIFWIARRIAPIAELVNDTASPILVSIRVMIRHDRAIGRMQHNGICAGRMLDGC